jgi:hypothetical protein
MIASLICNLEIKELHAGLLSGRKLTPSPGGPINLSWRKKSEALYIQKMGSDRGSQHGIGSAKPSVTTGPV